MSEPTAGTTTQPTVTATRAESSGDGLAAQAAAVEAARARFGQGLAQLEHELRAQIGYSVERILWKLAAAGAAVASGIVVRKALTAGWRAARKHDPPDDPAAQSAGWGEALSWTVASAVGIAVAKLVAERGAAAGWEKATGSPPPGD